MANSLGKKFLYYAKIVMLIILGVELILNIVYIAVVANIKDNYNSVEKKMRYSTNQSEVFFNQYQCVSVVFSFFVITFSIFIITFILDCMKESINFFKEEFFKNLVLLVAFLICQFLYFIYCAIIPIYLQRVKNVLYDDSIEEIKDKIKNIKYQYVVLTIICYTFLLLIIFMNFILLNLYKRVCCNMEQICFQTELCFKNFGRWISCNEEAIKAPYLKRKKDLTDEIKSLMFQNLEINIKNAYV